VAGVLLGVASVAGWILAQGNEVEQLGDAKPEQAVA
jgi:hypothetical protein